MKQTPLSALHRELGAKMVPFAGYEMPVQYPAGILREHLHTRAEASLFDVSHMGQIEIRGAQAPRELEHLLPLDLEALAQHQMAYTFLPNENGGVIDDVIVTRRGHDHFTLVVNAGCKDKVIPYLMQHLSQDSLHVLEEQALLALQGPHSAGVLHELLRDDVESLPFMHCKPVIVGEFECVVSRSGYTGEDGFEISLPAKYAEAFARDLLNRAPVKPAGLGARDSLRLEAGLCLYGHELSEETSPIAADISWTISKTRREGSKAGGFVGAEKILHQLKISTIEKRVGLVVQAKVPVRDGAVLRDSEGNEVGAVTSGTFSPSLGVPIVMATVETRHSAVGTVLHTEVRYKPVKLIVTQLPFVPHRYARS